MSFAPLGTSLSYISSIMNLGLLRLLLLLLLQLLLSNIIINNTAIRRVDVKIVTGIRRICIIILIIRDNRFINLK